MQAIGYLVGSGSMTLGVEEAGFEVLQVLETPGYYKNAQSWILNRPDVPVHVLPLDHNSDHFAAEEYQNIDLLYGNPPCGGMSSMTGSHINSPTNMCMRQWIRMVVKANPKMILMENGYQLATDRMKPLLTDLTDVLDAAGYWWWTWRFYSFQIGCPQIRQRMFLLASKTGIKNPSLVSLDDLPSHKDRTRATVKDALWDLQGIEPSPGPVTTKSGVTLEQHWYTTDEPINMRPWIEANFDRINIPFVTPTEFAAKQKKYEEAEDPDLKKRLAKELEKDEKKLDATRPKPYASDKHMLRPCVIKWDGPSPAVTGHYRLIHPIDKRVLTMREMARLMGYPDTWNFHKMSPHFIAQGIPVRNAKWAAERLTKAALG